MLCKEPDASSQYHSILKHRPPAPLLKRGLAYLFNAVFHLQLQEGFYMIIHAHVGLVVSAFS